MSELKYDIQVATPDESAAIPETPFCRELRSKQYFMLDAFATDASQYMDASNYCWCYETQGVVGPDGGKVKPERCAPGRKCYRSALADII